MTRIVVLNGVGSVGKSSLARALQAQSRVPLLHVAMDGFLEMLPEALQDHPQGISYEETAVGVEVRVGHGSSSSRSSVSSGTPLSG